MPQAADIHGRHCFLSGWFIWQHAVTLESICATSLIKMFFRAENTGLFGWFVFELFFCTRYSPTKQFFSKSTWSLSSFGQTFCMSNFHFSPSLPWRKLFWVQYPRLSWFLLDKIIPCPTSISFSSIFRQKYPKSNSRFLKIHLRQHRLEKCLSRDSFSIPQKIPRRAAPKILLGNINFPSACQFDKKSFAQTTNANSRTWR